MSALARSVNAIREENARIEGAFIDRVLYSASGSRDCLDIWLIREQELGDVVLSLGGIRFISIGKPDEIEQSFIDEVRVSLLVACQRDGFWRKFCGLITVGAG
jgi:hypothetical protein